MKRTLVLLAVTVFGLAVFLVACSSDNDGAADLLDNYQGHVSDADSVLSDYEAGTTDSAADYHDRMTRHVDGMTSVRRDMEQHCDQVDGCPMGGGATGEMSSGCMHGGQMLDSDDMHALEEHESTLREELDAHHDACVGGTADNVACAAYRPDHIDRMRATLDAMYAECDRMRQEHMGDFEDEHHGMC